MKIKKVFCDVSLKDLLKNSFLILVVILDVNNFGSYDIDEKYVSFGTLAGSNNPISEVSYSKKCTSDEIESINSDIIEISDEVQNLQNTLRITSELLESETRENAETQVMLITAKIECAKLQTYKSSLKEKLVQVEGELKLLTSDNNRLWDQLRNSLPGYGIEEVEKVQSNTLDAWGKGSK